MPAVEFWVVRVIVRAPKNLGQILWRPEGLDETQWRTVLARVKSGQYTCLPTGDIVEPVEMFEAQAKAEELARALAKQHAGTGEEFLIVLNADTEEIANNPGRLVE